MSPYPIFSSLGTKYGSWCPTCGSPAVLCCTYCCTVPVWRCIRSGHPQKMSMAQHYWSCHQGQNHITSSGHKTNNYIFMNWFLGYDRITGIWHHRPSNIQYAVIFNDRNTNTCMLESHLLHYQQTCKFILEEYILINVYSSGPQCKFCIRVPNYHAGMGSESSQYSMLPVHPLRPI